MKKFFIIDGDANLFSGLSAKLSMGQYQTIGYEGDSVKDVISRLLTTRPDYIILDLALPALDGFELLEKIKADDYLCVLPVFIYTTFNSDDKKNKAKRSGAEFYFSKKELSLDEFINKILKIISNQEKLSKHK